MTVRRLAQHPALGLTLVAGREGAERTIDWAHAIELVDPTPYLSGGELVMTTGMNVGANDREQYDYLTRLSAAGVAALAFDTGTTFAHVPTGILTAGDALGMPVLAVPAQTPFIAITRAVIDEVTADQLLAVQRIVDQQEAMAREALKTGIPGVVGALSTALSAAVVVLGADTHTLAASGPDTQRVSQVCADRIRGARRRTNRNQNSQVLADGDGYCTLQALRVTQAHRGWLAVRSDGPPSPLDRLLIAHAMSLISIAMDKPTKVIDAEHRLRGAVTRGLLTEPTTADGGLLRYFGFDPDQPVVVIVYTHTGPALVAEHHAQRALADMGTPYLMSAHTDQVQLVLPQSARAAAQPIRRALGAQLQRQLGAGVSEPGALDNLSPCLKQAQAAARAQADQEHVNQFADLGVFSILLSNRSTTELELMTHQLTPLDLHDKHDNAPGTGLLATLEAYLRENGQIESASTAMGIHRHTMRNRLAKIRELTNCNLETADARAEMWLALKARELLSLGGSTL